ncbi:Phosphatidylinositol 3,5-bisphosphate-binding protein [Didymosphaeria variabile]|uniref:Phosphatidylinositol 3,5-bisphosphate-binding protein n=1 Tax=Didymosphaeria variabile TaxID=1932322 RepID=A0A9W9CAG5_9PLEO|nr:Phosphatidylinositol 3,5-bisphosphate-binding protein [Didymosphaeria variabile]KAJ4352077.1 Phosphatidylinositol 3,5-bisphosphate-binding protein [Didymosphaeria variabile]
MNTRPVLDPTQQPFALAAAFNGDNKFFSVAHEHGFKDLSGGIGCADMVGTTNYIILAGGGRSPHFPSNKIQIWNDQIQQVSGSLELKAPVLRVRASKDFLVVVLPFQVITYKLGNPPQKIHPYDTVENPYGLCSFEENIVAMPGANAGQVRIVRLVDGNLNPRVTLIPAHTTHLRAVALNKKADMVATASEKGTIIRLWAVESGTKIGEFRRGIDEAAIFSLAFSPRDNMLAVTSDKSTVHIFDVPNGAQTAADINYKTHKYGILAKLPLLPRQFSDTYSSASTHFEMGDELGGWSPQSKAATKEVLRKFSPERVPTKGLLGWVTDNELLVIGAGQDARWEKFAVGVTDEGQKYIQSIAWKRYLD